MRVAFARCQTNLTARELAVTQSAVYGLSERLKQKPTEEPEPAPSEFEGFVLIEFSANKRLHADRTNSDRRQSPGIIPVKVHFRV